MNSGSREWRTTALALLLLSGTCGALAGPTLDDAITRHRVRLDPSTPEPAAPRTHAAIAVGAPEAEIPLLLAPTLAGTGASATVSFGGEPASPVARLGLRWHDEAVGAQLLEGTSLRWPLGSGALYASVERRHWGPGWTGSLILDAAAEPLPALGWRKDRASASPSPWLSWLGPWSADFFAAGLAGHREPEQPYLIGMRVTIQPWPQLELGASRVLQWGGEGRDESFRSLWRGLTGRDNIDGDDRSHEPGNQLGGVDFRFRVPTASGEWATYGQVVGEDEAGWLPSQLAVQLGTEWAVRRAGGGWRLFAEWNNLIAGDAYDQARFGSLYRHHIYRQGYTHFGRPLGHPVGGDVRLTSVGAIVDAGRASWQLMAHAGSSSPGAQRVEPNVTVAGLNAAAAANVAQNSRVGLSWWWWRAGDQRSHALQAWWQTAWP